MPFPEYIRTPKYLRCKAVRDTRGHTRALADGEVILPYPGRYVAARGIHLEDFFKSTYKCEIRPDTTSVTIIKLALIPPESPEMGVASLDIRQHGQYLIFDPNRRLPVASGRETLFHFAIRHLEMNTIIFLAYIDFHILGSSDIPHQNAFEAEVDAPNFS
jgi:hypothetical protein